MKNKKGFTLIEIIVCIVLISLIATISIILLKNNSDKSEDKNKKEIVSAADVYFSLNDKYKKELEENNGYLVLNISELVDEGLLDKKILDKLPKDSNGISYKKIIVKKKDEVLLGSGDDVGLYDYIYPYIENKDVCVFGTIYYYNRDFISTDSCVKEDDDLKYLNENYEIMKFPSNTMIDSCSDNLTSSFGLKYKVFKYRYNDEKKECPVRVEQCNERKIKLYMNKDEGESEYNGDWTNKDITLKLESQNNESDNCDNAFKIQMDNNEITNNSIIVESNKEQIINENKIIYFALNGEDKVSEAKQIRYDGIKPKIELGTKVGNRYSINLSDEGSGLESYKCNNGEKINISTNEATIYVTNSCTKITVWDIVGNKSDSILDYSNFKSIQINPLNEYEFEILFENYNELTNVTINYNYDENNNISKKYDVSNNKIKVNVFDFLVSCSENYYCQKYLKSKFTNKFILNFGIKNDNNELTNFNIKFNMSLHEYSMIHLDYSLEDSKIYLLGINSNSDILINNYFNTQKRGSSGKENHYYIYNKKSNEISNIYNYSPEGHSSNLLPSTGGIEGNYCPTDKQYYQNTDTPSNKLVYSFKDNRVIFKNLYLTIIRCNRGNTEKKSFRLNEIEDTYFIKKKNTENRNSLVDYNNGKSRIKFFEDEILTDTETNIDSESGRRVTIDYYDNISSNTINKEYTSNEILEKIRNNYTTVYNNIKELDRNNYEELYNPSKYINNASNLDKYYEKLTNGYTIAFFVKFKKNGSRDNTRVYLDYLYYKNLELVS